MKKIFKRYLWLWEFIGAAIIVGVGLICKFVPAALYFIVGIVFVFMGLFRIVPLVKTTEDKLLKWFYAAELVIDAIAGAVLIFLAIKKGNEIDDSKAIFGYIIGGILYLHGFVYFLGTALRKDITTFIPFLANIIVFTTGTWIIATGGFTSKALGWVLLAFAILSAGAIVFDGIKNYSSYRHEIAAKRITSNIKVEEEKVEAPTSDQIEIDKEEDVNTNIDKEIEEKPEIRA